MISKKIVEEISEGEEILHYSLEKLNHLRIKDDDKKLLSQVGIPRFAAPAIDFLKEGRGGLDRLSKYYGLDEQLHDYMILANCEEGVVVLNELTSEVDVIKSESLENIFVNSTLEQFINSLFYYNHMTSEVIKRDKNSEHYIDNMTKDDLYKFRKEVSKIDNMALSNNSFWYLIFVMLLEEISFNVM